MKIYIFSLYIAVCVLFSCTKDDGNYSYSALNKVVISGMEDQYYFTLNRIEKIQPILSLQDKGVLDTGRYRFDWVIDAASGYSIPKSVLSNKKVLDTLIKPQLGCASYFCYYRVTDTVTGVFTQKDFRMHVSTPSYEGWLLLCEPAQGTSRLDMISMSGDKDTLYKDVLSVVGSSYKATGAPAFVTSGPVYYPPARGLTAPLIGTSTDATMLGLDTLDYQPAYGLNSFINGPKVTDFADAQFYPRVGGALFKTRQGLYYSTYSAALNGAVNVYQDAPDPITLNKCVAYDYSGSNWIFFDDKANKFIRYAIGNTYCRTIPAGTLFDYDLNKTVTGGMKLVHFESIVKSYTTSEVFAILKANTTGKYYLARFNLTGTAQTFFEEIPNATAIDQATHFAVSPEYGYVFYYANGSVYEYDYAIRKSYKMYDYGNRKISRFEFPYFNFSDVARWSSTPLNYDRYSAYRRKLVIASYEEGNTNNSGKLDIFNVPAVNQPVQVFKSYTGMGKIMSIGFRER